MSSLAKACLVGCRRWTVSKVSAACLAVGTRVDSRIGAKWIFGTGSTMPSARRAHMSEVPKLTSLSHGGGCGCKISPKVLQEILDKMPTGNLPFPPELLVGKEDCDDAAVYKINEEQAIVCTTDFFMPIVDDPFDFGRIAATNAISDVYAMGGKPLLALAIVCMPIDKLPPATISKILEGGQSVCAQAGIPIAGGHTIDGLEVIYGLVVIGLVHPKQVKKNGGAVEGDALILSKPIGVGMLAASLKKNMLSEQGYQTLIKWTCKLNTPGAPLSQLNEVHALTDITGFGLAGHSLEIARASKLNLVIDWNKVPLVEGAWDAAQQKCVTGASGRNWESYGKDIVLWQGAEKIHQDFVTDPQTSGGLLVTCSQSCVDQVVKIFASQGFDAAVIGKVEKMGPDARPQVIFKA